MEIKLPSIELKKINELNLFLYTRMDRIRNQVIKENKNERKSWYNRQKRQLVWFEHVKRMREQRLLLSELCPGSDVKENARDAAG